MDETSKIFLTVLKAALLQKPAEPEGNIAPEQWRQLIGMACNHNVLPLFYEAVYHLPSLQQADQTLLADVKRRVRRQVMAQTLRTGEFLKLNDALLAAGIKPLVVKGIICRNLYPKPDCRQSGDEDVLIPPDQVGECHQIMTEFGMNAGEEGRNPDAYEISYRKEGSSLHIELHRHLFPPESDAYGDMNRFFEGVFDRAVPEQVQGHRVYTMCYTDHLFYLICHAFKHFLHSGFGIRQVCDIILFANAYGSAIDWEQVLSCCREIRAEKFAAALFRIGNRYLVFDPDKAAWHDSWRAIRVNEIPMLEDLLSGGIYGGADLSRRHSSSITLEAVSARKQGRKARSGLVTSAFPPAAKLEGRYPYLKKYPYLLPVAWCSRIWTYSRETAKTRNNSAAEALRIGSERIELMKEYGILN